MKIRIIILSILLIITGMAKLFGQSLSNARQKYIRPSADTIVVDSLSLVPGSLNLYLPNGQLFSDTSLVKIDFSSSRLYIRSTEVKKLADSLLVVYRVFPVLLTQTYKRKDRSVIEKEYSGLYNPYSYTDNGMQENIFRMDNLQRNGNISRGVNFGNNQDVVVNSSFNLQLSGKLSDDVEILAAITDNNIPVQPEGNTQQIQDFDKVFIQLSRNKSKLIVGDFELKKPDSYFMNFYKKAQGGVFSTEYQPGNNKSQVMRTTVSGSVSKGKFARNVFNGIEANQGPYRLSGAENESFIVVLSGTEKVFIDGVEMARGETYDYIIDYNTAEITFTPRRPITKDKRIVVEFQYSDKNYSRTLLFLNQEYEDSKWKVKANLYSEQDAKNQPLLQDLDTQRKQLLASVGDSIQQAFYPNIDSVAFNSSEVLYAKRDSAGFTFYEYSTDSTVAFYRLGFSYVGINKGNYVPVTTSANGRVYRWQPPVNNILQGSYEPVILLVAPKKQQMFTLGADYKYSSSGKAWLETAYSDYNINQFSTKDKADDKGYALFGGVQQAYALQQDTTTGWKLVSAVRLEHVNKNFTQIENFRPVEFSRDWNLNTAALYGDENSGAISLSLLKPGQLIGYQFRTFIKGTDYKGYMNTLNVNVTVKKFRLLSDESFLISNGTTTSSQFIRSRNDLSRPIGKFVIGAKFEQEDNRLSDAKSDSLLLNSFAFQSGQVYFASSDTSKTHFRVDYSRRYDYAVKQNTLKNSTVADEATGRVEFLGNPKSRLTLSSSYRNLVIQDTLLSALNSEESILNRVEYNAVILKGFITMQTFYEAATGQELKKEYAFVEVAPGTGVYAYAGDFNNNGVKDLDEFEVAAFADQANFIKVFIPTNEYVKTKSNQFNQSFTISPAAYFQKQEGWQKFVGRFSNQFAYRIDNKTIEKDLIKALNPFRSAISDSILLATNSSFRNTLSFNRSSTIFGLDVTWQDNKTKSLLTNGFESRVLRSWINNVRWNMTRTYSLLLTTENGNKKSSSEFFSAKDYNISFYRVEPKFSIQPGISFRTTFIYEYSFKENLLGEIGERAEQHTAGLELKYSSVKRGIVNGKFNLISIAYNADENNSISYEILEGLKAGKNYTWGVSLQRNLSNSIQLSLNYEGRKPQGTKIIHTGGVQARAFF